MNGATFETAALAALRDAGLMANSIEFDGALHRVPVVDKPHGRDGAYIAHSDTPVGSTYAINYSPGHSCEIRLNCLPYGLRPRQVCLR
jgi:hypothetical protein